MLLFGTTSCCQKCVSLRELYVHAFLETVGPVGYSYRELRQSGFYRHGRIAFLFSLFRLKVARRKQFRKQGVQDAGAGSARKPVLRWVSKELEIRPGENKAHDHGCNDRQLAQQRVRFSRRWFRASEFDDVVVHGSAFTAERLEPLWGCDCFVVLRVRSASETGITARRSASTYHTLGNPFVHRPFRRGPLPAYFTAPAVMPLMNWRDRMM